MENKCVYYVYAHIIDTKLCVNMMMKNPWVGRMSLAGPAPSYIIGMVHLYSSMIYRRLYPSDSTTGSMIQKENTEIPKELW